MTYYIYTPDDFASNECSHSIGIKALFLSVKNRWGTVLSTDVSSYDVMQLRLRGDGRTYMVSIQPPGYNTDDMYQAFIYTRGGPFWEEVTVSSHL